MAHIVWFKRDLRVADHAPLQRAAEAGPVIPLYVAEPALWQQEDASARQWAFVQESLEELRDALAALGLALIIREGGAIEVLGQIHAAIPVSAVWSHQETGNAWTYERDKAVRAWTRHQGIAWTEFPQHGVIRGLRSRNGWARKWDSFMRRTIVETPIAIRRAEGLDPGAIPTAEALGLAPDPCPGRQAGGRSKGLALLSGFLTARGARYQKEMSSPLTAAESCSRLSAHLAAGTLSMREVAQTVWKERQAVMARPEAQRGTWPPALKAYAARLHWHCHFIQKLEDAPLHETRNVHSGYDGLREEDLNHDHFTAWAGGRSGFPFVDACMRSLQATGWLNFRMRAMLTAFASYHLWLHWRATGLHLARLFTDYEPGIHWNQMQMQSGTTGINTLRVYNPVKQSRDQDPEGRFIRQWIPALRRVPLPFLHEPWRMGALEQAAAGCRLGSDYPLPLVDHLNAARRARERIYAVRRSAAFRQEAEAIQERHGSRKSGLPRQKPGKAAGSGRKDRSQRSLDL